MSVSEGHGEINIQRLVHGQYKIYFLKLQGTKQQERLVRIGAGETFNFYTMNDESDASNQSDPSSLYDSDQNSSRHHNPISNSSSLPVSINSDKMRAAAHAHVRQRVSQ